MGSKNYKSKRSEPLSALSFFQRGVGWLRIRARDGIPQQSGILFVTFGEKNSSVFHRSIPQYYSSDKDSRSRRGGATHSLNEFITRLTFPSTNSRSVWAPFWILFETDVPIAFILLGITVFKRTPDQMYYEACTLRFPILSPCGRWLIPAPLIAHFLPT